MPLRKSPSRPSIAVAALLATTALASTTAASASAASSLSTNLTCSAQTLSQPLKKFGDTANYWLAPGGDFEKATSGWTLKNSAISPGNETLGVLGGSKSLKLGVGLGSASVTTPEFCVDPLHPKFRFLVKATGAVAPAAMNTYINFKTPLGATLTAPAKLNTVSSGEWSLSESQPLSTAIPAPFLGTGVTASITIKAVIPGLGASLSIDNLLIDPYRRG